MMKDKILKLLKEKPMTREGVYEEFPSKSRWEVSAIITDLAIKGKILFKGDKYSIAPKRSKYGNKKTEADGYKFDSIKEHDRYQELKLLRYSGHISELYLQPKFKICDSVKWNGKKLQERYYIADFMYMENGKRVVEDVKSSATAKNPVYTLKKQLFLINNPGIVFREV